MKEAMFYERLGDNVVKCNLCGHRCRITDSNRGICAVRENRNGTLYSLVYGKVVARAVDPIEKKPLFNFLPGSRAYSIAVPFSSRFASLFHRHCGMQLQVWELSEF
jgi:pyruvate formate lyase activating enzyme